MGGGGGGGWGWGLLVFSPSYLVLATYQVFIKLTSSLSHQSLKDCSVSLNSAMKI